MSYTLVHAQDKDYVECLPGEICLRNEADALDLVAACGEYETHRLMIHASNLTPDFYDLSTRVAGEILLEFHQLPHKSRGGAAARRYQPGEIQGFCPGDRPWAGISVFYDRQAAEDWLLRD